VSARSARKEAQRFLYQLQAQAHAELGTLSRGIDPAVAKDLVNRYLRDSFTPEQGQDPEIRALAERTAARGVQSVDDMFSEVLAGMQDDIEKTAAARIEGMDLGRPLIGHLQTGQLNAVSMRVPGRSGAYLVLFEDQMQRFASSISEAVAWVIPHSPADANGMMTFKMSVRDATERIEANPEVADRFANIVVTYAVTGSLNHIGSYLMPPGYFNFARQMCDSLVYFVLGHEYAHILLGHLDTTAARKGVLSATEAEALVYSWQQENGADWLGMVLSINACIEHGVGDISGGFSGIGLFFDALDVMDRAVALLETGDENARQLGSHPPSDLRKQRLRDFLPVLGGGEPAGDERVRIALASDEIQGEIIRLLWERTRPILLDLRRDGVPAARTWRTIPKETGNEPAPAPPSAPVPKQVRRPGWRWGRSG